MVVGYKIINKVKLVPYNDIKSHYNPKTPILWVGVFGCPVGFFAEAHRLRRLRTIGFDPTVNKKRKSFDFL